MTNIKQLILTLVALLAVTTGAWADETLLLTIESTDYQSFYSGSKTFDDKVTVTFSNEVYNAGDEWGWYTIMDNPSLLTVAGINGYTITSCKFYTDMGIANTGYTVEGESPSVYLSSMQVYTDDSKSVSIGTYGVTKIEVYGAAPAAPTGPEVAWNKTSKTGTFKMPAGNVELQVEYYPGMLTLGSGAIEGGKLEIVGMTDDALPEGFEKDAEGNIYVKKGTEFTVKAVPDEGFHLVSWSDDATITDLERTITMGDEDLTFTATFSDKYTVALNAEGLSDEEAAAWKAATGTDQPAAFPLENVKAGTEVKVTYTGTKKIIGVKAEKKSAAVMTTVTWNSSNVFNSAHKDVELDKWSPTPLSYEGITISFSGTKVSSFQAYDEDDHIGSLTCYGNDGDSFTFTAPSGKKFCKIEIINNGFIVFDNYGDWTRDADNKIVWSGTAANAVTLGSVLTDADNLNSIVFYLSE